MKSILARVLSQDVLTREETKEIIFGITKNEYPSEQIVALLTGLQMRGITVDELLGFRDGILETGVPAVLDTPEYIDIVGTGGDQKNTFNISTCACFVVAGAGYKVAKHGNYAATSVSGASNVIEAHGVKFTSDIDKLNRSMNECNIVYLHAQLFARAMKFVGPIRKALEFPTCFNLLGPIVNPSQPKCQLLGVANLNQMRLYNAVYQKMGINYGIETSIDGYDEISLTGDFKVTTNNYEKLFKPSDIGLNIADAKDLEGGKTKEEAARIFDSVLENTSKIDHKEVVIANAAFAIQIMEPDKSIEECVAIAKESIESGAALKTLNKFIQLNS
ncbi:MAG TPA: anthranilate phosphoribosyltransferase [Xylanibacter oryzae]|uniref:anthranilate phosphoribosyltransferase n=1 Tax=Xylanibacter oryzae TaxID=185293 RepID=UPI00055FCE9F|nr:anthranilate phosphoribosyltransferase [Xylanibacter oryzae]HRN16004.1 anthranilate phosphoribosyltransferase [Xylanibacter oryzae]